MNFFGHCVLASWCRTDAGFLLGAMLPDLANMMGGVELHPRHPAVNEGIAYHHLTDRIFHQGPSFLRMQERARKWLKAAGVRRGPTLAVAHVGVELLLDAELSNVSEYRAHYLKALGFGKRTATDWLPPRPLGFALRALCRHLERRAPFLTPRNAEEVTRRLQRILERRPALALRFEELAPVADWVQRFRPLIRERLPAWTWELRRQHEAESADLCAQRSPSHG